jgi:alkylation response protein AidB-like acyl-CoA dehydrogenase
VLVFEKGTPGFEVLRLEDKMGHRASSTAAAALDTAKKLFEAAALSVVVCTDQPGPNH